MEFNSPLIKGRLLKRYKRFLADVELSNGEVITAHCPNTGAMTHCAEPNMDVLLRYDPNPKRKLAYTWEIAINSKGQWIGINTHNANKLVGECLLSSNIIADVSPNTLRREFTLPSGTSRIDFAIIDDNAQPLHFIEVKSVTLCDENNVGYFPDTVTTRGKKHCEELEVLSKAGYTCTLVFCVQHSGIEKVTVAEHIDAQYAQALRSAISSGVNIVVCGVKYANEKLLINQKLTFNM